MQQRHSEGEGLAHAGARLADQVIAGQCQRQGEFLNREGVLDALLGKSADDLLADAEIGEAHRRFFDRGGLLGRSSLFGRRFFRRGRCFFRDCHVAAGGLPLSFLVLCHARTS